MGYYANSMWSDVKIHIRHTDALKQAFKNWVNTSCVLEEDDICKIIHGCRYEACIEDDYIIIDYFSGEKWGMTDDEFPAIIAHFIEEPCEIAYSGEDDCCWKYVFENGTYREVTGETQVVWDDEEE